MKPIQIKKNYIEIPVQDDTGETLKIFKFEITDDSFKRIFNEFDEMKKKGKELEQSDLADDEANDYIKGAFNNLLGEGAYEFFYELNPSVVILMHYLITITSGIIEEVVELYSDDKLNKYVYGK